MFNDQSRAPDITGKVIIAYQAQGALLVGAQADRKSPGRSITSLRNALAIAGFTDAIFADGSDSAMFWYKGRQVIAPGKRKNAEMTVAIGFLEEKSSWQSRKRGG